MALVLTIAMVVGWILFDVLICVRTSYMTSPFPTWERWTWLLCGILLALVAGAAAVYSHSEDVAQHREDSARINTLTTVEHDTNQQVHSMAVALQKQAESINPATVSQSVKKQALQLASLLLRRTSDILLLAGRHGAILPLYPTPSDIAMVQQERMAHEQADELTVALFSDYKAVYADDVSRIRQACIAEGQDWKNASYLSDPKNVMEVRSVASDLLDCANKLK